MEEAGEEKVTNEALVLPLSKEVPEGIGFMVRLLFNSLSAKLGRWRFQLVWVCSAVLLPDFAMSDSI